MLLYSLDAIYVPVYVFVRQNCTRQLTCVLCVSCYVIGFDPSRGAGEFGQLGQSRGSSRGAVETTSDIDETIVTCMVPKIARAPGVRAARVAAGEAHTLLLTGSGHVYSCGQGILGGLGLAGTGGKRCGNTTDATMASQDSETDDDEVSAMRVKSRSSADQHSLAHIDRVWSIGVVKVACGDHHSVCLSCEGHCYSWGRGRHGQLGHAVAKNASLPTLIGSMAGEVAADVACGSEHTLILTHTGELFSCGRGKGGRLGLGDDEDVWTPRRIQGAFLDEEVMQADGGRTHSIAVTASGAIYVWGSGLRGQLSTHVEHETMEPVRVSGVPRLPVAFVSAGGDHCIAVFYSIRKNSSRHTNGMSVVGGRGVTPQWGARRPSISRESNRISSVSGQMDESREEKECELLQPAGYTARPMELPPLLELAEKVAADVIQIREKEVGDEAGPVADAEAVRQQQQQNHEGGDLARVAEGNYDDRSEESRVLVGSGGDNSECTTSGREHQHSREPQRRRPTTQWTTRTTTKSSSEELALVAAIENIFFNVGFLSAGFTLPPEVIPVFATASPGAGPRPVHSGLDVDSIELVYQTFLKTYSTDIIAALANASGALLDQLLERFELIERRWHRSRQRAGDGASSPTAAFVEERELKALMILLQSPLLGSDSVYRDSLCSRAYECIMRLPPADQHRLASWAACYPSEVFVSRLVRPCQRYISEKIRCAKYTHAHALFDSIYTGIVALAILQEANEMTHMAAYSEFHNRALSECVLLRDEYLRWMHFRDELSTLQTAQSTSGGRVSGISLLLNGQFVSVCQIPFVLTPDSKRRILQGEADLQKQHEVHTSHIAAIIGDPETAHLHSHYLVLNVRREHLLEDAMRTVERSASDLKKPLKVKFFCEGVAEEGVDEGGVAKEFFQLLVREIFNPESAPSSSMSSMEPLFTYADATRTFWFNMNCKDEYDLRLVGVIIGLAIYNGVILDVHFPLIVYKKLVCGRSVMEDRADDAHACSNQTNFEDLREAMPELWRSLNALLEYDGDVETDLCLTFELSYECLGGVRTVELLPGGATIPVTAENRTQYVYLYTDFMLNRSVEAQFLAFKQGFEQVCGGPALSLFRPEELELLVCGLPHLDFVALERVATYEGGYHAHHPLILRFWSVLHAFSLELKKRFLFFTTGCDRAPIQGLAELRLTIQRSGPDTDRLPTSHTCFNTLLCPEYVDVAKLRERLTTAILNSEGFGLQ